MMNPIFQKRIEAMSIDELTELNRVVVDSLRRKRVGVNRAKSLEFMVGDAVYFFHKEKRVEGKIIRINQKTATIKTSPVQTWRVSWNLIKKAEGHLI